MDFNLILRKILIICQRRELHFGDVLYVGGTLTFKLARIKGQGPSLMLSSVCLFIALMACSPVPLQPPTDL